MNLKKGPKRGIDKVCLTDCSVEDLDGVLATFHIDDLSTEIIKRQPSPVPK